MKKKLSHIELFAGIGGFRRAIDLFCADNGLTPVCKGFSEFDKSRPISYSYFLPKILFQDIKNISAKSF